MTISEDPKIISLAHALGIHDGERVEGILGYCRNKVKELLAGVNSIRSIDDLQHIVCEKLCTTIIEVYTDADIAEVVEKYARQEKEPAFAGIPNELTDETFATLLQRKRRAGEQFFRYVAVIDCRGAKVARRYFSRWHEIAHVLTTVSQLQFPLHRSTTKKDACEKMMDLIASDIGFYGPLFEPLLERECIAAGGFTFAVAESVRQEFSPTASMEATLNACAARIAHPIIILQAKLGYKKAEKDALDSGQYELFPAEKPIAQLRVVSVVPNPEARASGLIIPKNMRVPRASIMMTAMQSADDHQSVFATENMNWWRTSDGKALNYAVVRVEALRIRDRVWAIIHIGNPIVRK